MPDGTPIVPVQTTTPEPSQAAPAPQSVAPISPVYTQDQVDAMLKQAHDSAAAAVRRSLEGRAKQDPQPPTPKPDPAPQPASGADVASLVAQAVAVESAFGEAVREHGLNGEQSAMLRMLRASANLSDPVAVSAWVKEKAAVFGKASTTATAPVGSPPNAPPPLAPFAPNTAVPLERDISAMDMSADQVHALMRKKGGRPDQPYHPLNRAARREIRTQVLAAMQSRRFRVG